MDLPACCEIKPSSLHGLGVFAKVEIPKGTVLGEYRGDRYTLREFKEKYGTDYQYCYVARRENLVICCKERRNWISYMNEKRFPNCKVTGNVCRTVKPVSVGEELCLLYPVDYPRDYSL